MVRIAPVRLTFNPKVLWFDANDLDLCLGDPVVVKTNRGSNFGYVCQSLFELDDEQKKKLRSPLQKVQRKATEDDKQRAEEKARLSLEAMPVFRKLAEENTPDMNPIAVEYLFDEDRAIFYFDSENRVDFRNLVRKLASELSIKVDMKQVGVRDGARLIGGLGHCGQEMCCTRMGTKFNLVSIRMAKEQNLSLNQQKISGACGRLMCCLRYEYDAYQDFHKRAPKKNARIKTPEGEGVVVNLDALREVISIQVEEEKPVKVPLADMKTTKGSSFPNKVDNKAWEEAKASETPVLLGSLGIFDSQIGGDEKLGDPTKVSHLHGSKSARPGAKDTQGANKNKGENKGKNQRRRRRRASVNISNDQDSHAEQRDAQKTSATSPKVGQMSSALRNRKTNNAHKRSSASAGSSSKKRPNKNANAQSSKQDKSSVRRHRRSHKAGGAR